jgi:hypothetical protein
MKVFLSHSGPTSRQIANALAWWLPRVIQAVEPWVSTKIQSGARWAGEIAKELDLDYIGVICLTPENLDAPWILFEAGALSKGVDASRVVPYLWGLEPSDVMWPLAQFQMCRADREDTFKLLQMIDRKLGETALRPDQLTDAFETWWPRLEERLIEIGRAPVPNAEGRRPVADMVEEMLLAVRELEHRTADVQANVKRLTGAPPERLLLPSEGGRRFGPRPFTLTLPDLDFTGSVAMARGIRALAELVADPSKANDPGYRGLARLIGYSTEEEPALDGEG